MPRKKGSKPVMPKYKSPLPTGLTKPQVMKALAQRTVLAKRGVQRAKERKPRRPRNPAIRTKEWRLQNKRFLSEQQNSQHLHNKFAASKLLVIIEKAETGELSNLDDFAPTLWAVLDRLKKAVNKTKEMKLNEKEVILLKTLSR